eukprot:SAG31_NODE_24921_length_472_cov_0.549598_1_plen_42_part_10
MSRVAPVVKRVVSKTIRRNKITRLNGFKRGRVRQKFHKAKRR